MQQGPELRTDTLAGQRMLEAEIRSSEVRSDLECLEEDCRQGSACEFNQARSINTGVGGGCMG